ncbi:MAG: metallopeptidase family protein [Candidatus Nanopelagicales bacterium]
MTASASMPSGPVPRPSRRRRDLHGRGLRGTLAPATMPVSRSRAANFDELVLSAVERIQQAYPELADVEIRVEEVPLRERRDGSPDPVSLGRLHLAVAGRPAQLIIHRRPIELRAPVGTEREDLVNDTVTELVAQLFGLSPIQIDPDYGQDNN